jgi:hypothetical protein
MTMSLLHCLPLIAAVVGDEVIVAGVTLSNVIRRFDMSTVQVRLGWTGRTRSWLKNQEMHNENKEEK